MFSVPSKPPIVQTFCSNPSTAARSDASVSPLHSAVLIFDRAPFEKFIHIGIDQFQ